MRMLSLLIGHHSHGQEGHGMPYSSCMRNSLRIPTLDL